MSITHPISVKSTGASIYHGAGLSFFCIKQLFWTNFYWAQERSSPRVVLCSEWRRSEAMAKARWISRNLFFHSLAKNSVEAGWMHSEDLRGISKLMIFAVPKCGLQYVSLSFYGPFLPCQTLLKALEEIFYKNRWGVCPELQEFLLMELSSGWIFGRFLLFFVPTWGTFQIGWRCQIW